MSKLANIVREHVNFDMFANNVAQFGHYVRQQIRSKNVRGMFVHAQNIFANICCSIECCLIWPICSRAIRLSQVKLEPELCDNHLSRLLLARV